MRPDQKRAMSDLRCASRKIAELFRENNRAAAAETLEDFVSGLGDLVKKMEQEAA